MEKSMLNWIVKQFAVAAAPTPVSRIRLGVECSEDRAVPAAWTAATVAELVQHIDDANALPGPDTITLAPGATFSLTAVNNTTHGPTGLPVVTDGDGLTIVGNGATIERGTAAGTAAFRLFDVAAGAALALHGVTLQGGAAGSGGAVYSLG